MTIAYGDFEKVHIRVGTIVTAVVNFERNQIGLLKSEVPVLGFPDAEGGKLF